MKKDEELRIALVRREDKPVDAWKQRLATHGLAVDQKNPTLVFSIGGDGTFLIAERRYPGIPKVLIRDSKICNRCFNGTPDELLARLKNRDYAIRTFQKLEVIANGKTLLATNDVSVRNHLPTMALRFSVTGKGIPPHATHNELIGDGIVVATSFGAPAYFYAITKQTFASGFGIAWNNVRNTLAPVFLPTLDITLNHVRTDAVISVDNNPDTIHLKEGKTIRIKTSNEHARILHFH